MVRMAVFGMLIGGLSAAAQQPDPIQEQLGRFELFTGCAPLILDVEADSDRPDYIASVTAAAESRLRAARLFLDRSSPGALVGPPP